MTRADDVEHVGIHEVLHWDWLTVRPPAQLHVERVDTQQAVWGLRLVITDPEGL